jgi:uncharacterized oligopeptide transporter (OPT) family protein
MHHSTKIAIAVGLIIGVGLAITDKFAPKNVKAFVPSANGIGIAMVVPGSNSIAMFIGSAIAEIMRRRQQDGMVVPVASGLIAGESLMGVLIVVLSTIVGWNLKL